MAGLGVKELRVAASIGRKWANDMHSPVENFGLVGSLACAVSGTFLLYDGANSQFQVIGGATLLSVGLVVALLITKNRWQKTVWRYRRHLR